MRRTSGAALTLVEMLVAMAVTLIMMGAVVTMFGNVGNSISGSRGVMEISERLRNCRNVLQRDVSSATATMIPPRRPENDEGSFEYIEGPDSDLTYLYTSATPPVNNDYTGNGLPGDTDDVLMFTVRSKGEPFVGKFGTSTIQSQTALVVWYATVPTSSTLPAIQVEYPGSPSRGSFPLRTLYRRIFLVVPSIGRITGTTLADYYKNNDISVRVDGSDLIANTLGDLTKPENRFSRDTVNFPFEWVLAAPFDSTSGRMGEDVILTNVLAFDVKAYDPTVTVKLTSSNIAVLPSDAGYAAATTVAGSGGYVDLNYNRYTSPAGSSSFSGAGFYTATLPGVYDTWSMHYNSPIGTVGGTNFTGNGTDGLDNDSNGIVDDPAEMQAPPPYPVPLRGIQVKIRVYEPDSRQVREVTVVQDFLPQ